MTKQGNIAEEWLRNLDKLNEIDCLSDCSKRAYRTRSLLYLRSIDSPTEDNCRSYIKSLSNQGLKPQTINMSVHALTRLFRANGLNIKLKCEKTIRTLSTENVINEVEWNTLLNYLKDANERYYHIIMMLGTTGLRIHEALKVTYEDIHSGQMIIRGKGGKRRYVFFCERLQDECKGWHGYVCVSKSGMVITTRAISTQMKIYGKKCGIATNKMHPHAFRHFFAKQYLKACPDGVFELSKLLGHSSIETTMIYLEKSQKEMESAYKSKVLW